LLHLLLTLDYEIFGNGAGDVMRDVILPTRRLLDICDRHGAKLTIMFEVGEYGAFERYASQLRRDLGYSPAEKMREQALEAVQRGHDVQLHLHPQWIGAEYADQAWRLANSQWRLADLPGGLGDERDLLSVVGALHAGKRTLETTILPVKTDYKCVCFRAGGFYAQPSGTIITALKRVGLLADSSVVKGHRTSKPFAVDYSCVETGKEAWWTTDAELTREGKPGENVFELCVSSRMEPYWKSFKLTKLHATIQRGKIERASCSCSGTSQTVHSVPTVRTILRKLFSPHASTFDFCKLSAGDMWNRMRAFDKSVEQPVVLIGHSKDFFNDAGLDHFLARVEHDDRVVFETTQHFITQTVLSESSGS
jgi:hypothetical protein